MASSGDRNRDDDRVSVLTFTVGGDRYCVRAASVDSVLGVGDDQSVATADDPWNAGTVSVAGDRIRVVDLHRAFASSVQTTSRIEAPKLLVFRLTDGDDRYVGWLVDSVDVTRTIRTSDLESTPTSSRIAHVKGRLEIDGDEVVWLDERAIHG